MTGKEGGKALIKSLMESTVDIFILEFQVQTHKVTSLESVCKSLYDLCL